MAHNIRNSDTRFPLPRQEILRRIRQSRWQKAFPALTKFFPELATAMAPGFDWENATDDYIARLGNGRLLALYEETFDLYLLGQTAEGYFEAELCDVLGLPSRLIYSQGRTPLDFMAALTEHLSQAAGERR